MTYMHGHSETVTAPSPVEALELGWSIIPCGRNKKPIVSSWKPFQNRLATPKEIADWTELHPSTWSLITGRISGRITLDFDGEIGRRTLKTLGLAPHRSTPSGGYHVDFRHPGWYVQTLNSKSKRELGKLWPGLDIRADGGYAVFSGRTERGEYKWLRDTQTYPLDILPDNLRKFLGLLHPPTMTQTPPEIGHLRASPEHRRVDAEQLVRTALDHAASEGRNNAGFGLAIQLRDNGYSRIAAETNLLAYAKRCPATNTKGIKTTYGPNEARASVREAYSRPARDPWGAKMTYQQLDPTTLKEVDLLHQPHTDTGNAERLVALYGRDIKFCPAMKKWLSWEGCRWNTEDTRRVKGLAKRTIRQMYAQAASIERSDIKELAEKHARKSESAYGINSMLTCAEYEESIPVSANELDQHGYLLNCLNGTLDLRSGHLREHRREDLLTKLVHLNYSPSSTCPTFRRFLDRIMGAGPDASDAELDRAKRLVSYLQKCFGYSLSGDVSEKTFFCFCGSGNNGKTTLLEAIRFVLPEYSAQVFIDSLMEHHSRESNASLADLSDLRGARFVTTSEAEEGQRLAVGKLKYLTQGTSEIKACRKYENPVKFIATHKLFLDTNHKPTIRGVEKAVWNRLKLIPFAVTIGLEEMDKALLDKLREEAEGILVWMVEGFRRWLKEGLGDPPEVAEATAAWQAESDRMLAFLQEICMRKREAWVPVSQLWLAYQNWRELDGDLGMLTKFAFSDRLRDYGCTQGKRNGGTTRVWLGIRLKTPEEDKATSRTTGHGGTSDVDK